MPVRDDLRGVRVAPRLSTSSTRRSPRKTCNVKIVCALPGLTTGYGPSHQATEDLAIFRGMPNLTIIDPCDALDIEQAVPAIAAHNGPVYMRLLRGQVPLVLDEYDYTFELGKAKLLRDGKDVLIISTGFMTMRALEAVETAGAPTTSTSPCCTCRRSSRSTRRPSCARPAAAAASWSLPRTTRSSAGWARPSPACCCAPVSRRRSARSLCPTPSSTPARCRRCTTSYGISTVAMTQSIKGWLN